jgi:AraC family transcriptional regulator of adaptative response/methylated-DNA-[protein]-cysteine methyltransferase
MNDAAALQIAWLDSPVGVLRIGASASALHLLQFVDEKSPPAHSSADNAILEQTRRELAEYFAGTRRGFDVPISFTGTPFQKRVWTALCNIPYGERVSYLEQSRMVGDELAIRAVAQANGQNPIAILIPCHRVINASGQLGGFGGGLLRKQFLLDLERGDRLL